MKLQLTIYELGHALKKISDESNLNILIKSPLSGGWITITGKANISKIPEDLSKGCSGRKDNIIHIKINEDHKEEILVKITGTNDKKFNVDIASSRYRELSAGNITINQIKVNENETKIKIDENIIFTVQNNINRIMDIIK